MSMTCEEALAPPFLGTEIATRFTIRGFCTSTAHLRVSLYAPRQLLPLAEMALIP